MFLVDPVGLLFANTLVGLLAMAFLLLSNVAARPVRGAVYLWVLGDAFSTMGRLVLLSQPGVIHTVGLSWLTPVVVDLLHGGLVVASAVLHTLAIRQAVDVQARLSRVWPLMVAVPLAYAALAAMLPTHVLRLQLMLAIAFVFVVWTCVAAWPRRHDIRGARLITWVMGFFGLMMALSFVASHADQSAASAVNLPPMPAILLDLSSALAMTMAFTLVLFESLHRKIELLSITDPLTGTLNRRGFMDVMKAGGSGAKSSNDDVPLALAILDLDHFKRINDKLGHAMGDKVLVGFSKRLREVTRSTDVIARWGGEEFVLLMPRTDRETGWQVAERVRDAISAQPLAPGAPLVTVSIGIATLHIAMQDDERDALLACADERLYRAKMTRNCVVAA